MEDIKNRYHNGKIYTIRSHQTEKFYIGSTCLPLCKRLYKHRDNKTTFDNGTGFYLSSFEILKYDDHYIELLEEYKCKNKQQLEKREGELIRLHKNNCVNINVAGRNIKEWRQDNKEHIKEIYKIWCNNNKEHIKEVKKLYVEKHIENIKEDQKQRYINDKEKYINKAKEWVNNNKEERKEYLKKYSEVNKAELLLKQAKYREEHKEAFKEKMTCICGSVFRKASISHHNKTLKHQEFIKLQPKE